MIEVQGITKKYGSKVVVDNLSFTVAAGRVTGFLGPNGSGKSTTMRCMLGLDRPQAGTTLFNGQRYETLARPLREVGALLDASYVHPGRSARNHLRYLAASNGLPAKRVSEVVDMVGLGTVMAKRVGTYSLGMKQRLGIASALLGNPNILMFDEPVNGLDPEGIHWMRSLMRYLASEGRAVLVSSHLLSEMAQTADDLIVIGQGRLISASTVEQFIAANVSSWVTVRSPDANGVAAAATAAGGSVSRPAPDELAISGLAVERVGELAAQHGHVLHELTTHRASLEDAFLRATSDTLEYRAVLPQGAPLPPPPPPSVPTQPDDRTVG